MSEYLIYKLVKLGVLAVAAFCWRFWLAFTGRR